MQTTEVKISYRDCQIDYTVDMKSIATMAKERGIEWYDMKKALRSYGFVIRKHEPQPENPNKTYVVNLVDKDKIVPETPVKTAAAVTTAS